MSVPLIGLNCDIVEQGTPRAQLHLAYIEFVERAGGVPTLLPPCPASLTQLSRLDGIVLTGGDDYLFASEPGVADLTPVAPCRESYDVALARRCLATAIPTLGICGGVQLLVAVAGGTLVSDLPSQLPSDIQHRRERGEDPIARHDIRWERDWGGVARSGEIVEVNSHHHQAIDALPAGWQSLARAPDGIVEAVRGPLPFMLGVQWHPEKDLGAPLTDAIGASFLMAARGNGRP